MSRAALLPLLLSTACSSDHGLHTEGPEHGTRNGPTSESAQSPGEVHYIEADEDLQGGVTVWAEEPFRSFTLVWTAPLDSELSLRHPLPDGSMTAWRPVTVDEDLGLYGNGHQVLPVSVDFVELRASAGASFVELSFYEGTVPMYDDALASDGSLARTASPGMWTMPEDTWLIAQEQYIPYTGASSCTGSLTAGAKALGDYLVENFEATSYGGYNCRTIGDSSTLSVHSEGRAIDLYVPMDGSGDDAAANDLGDPIANWLAENAELIGMSYVIWDQASWGAHRSGDKHQSYGGSHPHNDHLHIELSWDGAEQRTAWFDNPDDATEPQESGDPGEDGSTGEDPQGDVYLVGDWDGDGRDNLAVRRGGEVYMDTDFDGLAEVVLCYGDGDSEDAYLVGDWAGQGLDRLAVLRGDTVLMDTDGGGAAELSQVYGNGASEDQYLVGDWDGDGTDDLAVRRGDTVYMDTNDDGLADLVQLYGNGASEDEYLVGDWDGDGRDNLAVRRGDTVYMDTDFSGGAELVELYGNGASEDEYLVGDWDGDGVDDLAVRRRDTVYMDTNGDGLADLIQVYGDG